MQRDVLIERFFTALISGDRPGSRAIVEELLDANCPADRIITRLFWPALDQVQKLHRADQLSDLGHHYATRLLRMHAEQMQMRLEQADRRGKKVLLVAGSEESEELSAHMAADLMEADGYDVFYAGGGVAADEVVEEIGRLNADVLVIFGATAPTVPYTRQLIDRLHDTGVCPRLQVVVGGGVFNRAEGLAEEIGADLWARDPEQLVTIMHEQPDRRMEPGQRTVGRKRKPAAASLEAA